MTVRLFCAALWAVLLFAACGGEDPSNNPTPSPTISASPTPSPTMEPVPVACGMDNPCTETFACMSGFCTKMAQGSPDPIDCSHLSWMTTSNKTFSCTLRGSPETTTYKAKIDPDEAVRAGACIIRDESDGLNATFGLEDETHGRELGIPDSFIELNPATGFTVTTYREAGDNVWECQ